MSMNVSPSALRFGNATLAGKPFAPKTISFTVKLDDEGNGPSRTELQQTMDATQGSEKPLVYDQVFISATTYPHGGPKDLIMKDEPFVLKARVDGTNAWRWITGFTAEQKEFLNQFLGQLGLKIPVLRAARKALKNAPSI